MIEEGMQIKCIKDSKPEWIKGKSYIVEEILDKKYSNGGIYMTTNQKNISQSVGWEDKLKEYFEI